MPRPSAAAVMVSQRRARRCRSAERLALHPDSRTSGGAVEAPLNSSSGARVPPSRTGRHRVGTLRVDIAARETRWSALPGTRAAAAPPSEARRARPGPEGPKPDAPARGSPAGCPRLRPQPPGSGRRRPRSRPPSTRHGRRRVRREQRLPTASPATVRARTQQGMSPVSSSGTAHRTKRSVSTSRRTVDRLRQGFHRPAARRPPAAAHAFSCRIKAGRRASSARR